MRREQYQDMKQVTFRGLITLFFEELTSPFLENLPFFIGSWFRVVFVRIFSKACGSNLFIAHRVSIRHLYQLEVGGNVGINQDTIIHCRGGVRIGNDVFMGQRVIINTGDHDVQDRDRLIREQKTTYRPVVIGNDVFLGMGCMIMPGVTVADGTVVAAGAVVTKDTLPYTIVAGVPAKTIRERISRTGSEFKK